MDPNQMSSCQPGINEVLKPQIKCQTPHAMYPPVSHCALATSLETLLATW